MARTLLKLELIQRKRRKKSEQLSIVNTCKECLYQKGQRIGVVMEGVMESWYNKMAVKEGDSWRNKNLFR